MLQRPNDITFGGLLVVAFALALALLLSPLGAVHVWFQSTRQTLTRSQLHSHSHSRQPARALGQARQVNAGTRQDTICSHGGQPRSQQRRSARHTIDGALAASSEQ
jgi:hypothetical protein